MLLPELCLKQVGVPLVQNASCPVGTWSLLLESQIGHAPLLTKIFPEELLELDELQSVHLQLVKSYPEQPMFEQYSGVIPQPLFVEKQRASLYKMSSVVEL